MGRCNYSAYGFGMTEQEARRDAINTDRTENGHQEGYTGTIGSSTEETLCKCITQPKPAKKCKVDKTVHQGARKWETRYIIASTIGDCYCGYGKTQGEAIKKAKEMALKTGYGYNINLEKVIVNGSNRIAAVYPKESTMGKWLFQGMARE